MISEKVYKLCTSPESVSALLAQDPTMAPGDAWKKLYGHHEAGDKESSKTATAHRKEHTPEDLQRALACGNWGPTQPSELFLKVRNPWHCFAAETDYTDVSRCALHAGSQCFGLHGQSVSDG